MSRVPHCRKYQDHREGGKQDKNQQQQWRHDPPVFCCVGATRMCKIRGAEVFLGRRRSVDDTRQWYRFRTTVNYELSFMNFRCIWAQDLVVVKHLRCPFKHVCGNYVVTYGVRIGGNINSINAAILRQAEHFIPLHSVGSRGPDGYSATLCSDISPDGGWRGDFV